MSEINILLLIVGLALAIFGWTLYRAGVRCVGLLTGLFVGLFIGGIIITLSPSGTIAKHAELILILLAFIGSLCGFIIIKKLNNLLFFFIGSLSGIIMCKSITPLLPGGGEFPFSTFLYLILAIVSGIVVLKLQRHIIIIFTSFVGSMLIWASLFSLSKADQLVFFIPILVVSLFVQMGWYRLMVLKKR